MGLSVKQKCLVIVIINWQVGRKHMSFCKAEKWQMSVQMLQEVCKEAGPGVVSQAAPRLFSGCFLLPSFFLQEIGTPKKLAEL